MKLLLCLISVFGLLASSSIASGQAYCSLRDPHGALGRAFPDLESHRSIVRTVRENDRSEILDQLPFTIHPKELCNHTLYAGFDDEKHFLGLIHVRSERGRWGLTEIAWTLGSDLRVQGLRIQRTRDLGMAYLESDEFLDQVVGKNFEELRELVSDDGKSLTIGKLEVPDDSKEIAFLALRSILKTIAATRIVWGKDLAVFSRNSSTF